MAAGEINFPVRAALHVVSPDDAQVGDIELVVPFLVQKVPPGIGVVLADDQAVELVLVERADFVGDFSYGDLLRFLENGLLYGLVELYGFQHRRFGQIGLLPECGE